MLILGTIVIRPDIASRVIRESTLRIRDSHLDLHSLANRFLANRIINESERLNITDEYTRQNYDERMDMLLRFLLSSIRMNGERFNIFLCILREEDNVRSDELAAELMRSYQAYATNNEQ